MGNKAEENYKRFLADLNGAEELSGDRKIIMLLSEGLLNLRELKKRKSITGEMIPDMRERYRKYIND